MIDNLKNIIIDKIKRRSPQSFLYYKLYLRGNNLKIIKSIPKKIPYSSVLKTKKEYQDIIKEARSLGLIPLYPPKDAPKNWDSLSALSIILREKRRKSGRILDAGGEHYSVILPWLLLYGYRKLNCINPASKKGVKKYPHLYKHQDIIKYGYDDMTSTKFKSGYFDAITCLSVIEHGINLDDFFKEASRILKRNGILVCSVDYWQDSIDTKRKRHFGVPLHIFTKEEIIEAIKTAKKYGLNLLGELKLDCKNKTVNWLGLQYTFMYFTLKKSRK